VRLLKEYEMLAKDDVVLKNNESNYFGIFIVSKNAYNLSLKESIIYLLVSVITQILKIK